VQHLTEARKQYQQILARTPHESGVKLRDATNLSKLNEHDACLAQLESIDDEFWRRQPKSLENRHLAAALQGAIAPEWTGCARKCITS